jgi:hypothetical protein
VTDVSTDEAVDAIGITYRRLDYLMRRGFVSPRLRPRSVGGRPVDRRWSPADVAAARVASALLSSNDSGRSSDLARLASQAVSLWAGRAEYVVVALPDVIEPSWSGAEACLIVDDLRLENVSVATVIRLALDA